MTIHDEIYKVISQKLGIHKDVIEAVCRSQFEFVTETMYQANLDEGGKAVRLQYLGIFRVKPKRLEKLREKYERIRLWKLRQQELENTTNNKEQ